MSRSNQTELINPCIRWMEWNGQKGNLKYYDKQEEKNIELPFALTFILLDVLSCVKGWHDSSDSGIYSNEVKDLAKEPLVVKAFKGGILAQGFYKEIKDKVVASGGHFTSSIYCGIKVGEKLEIANLQFKGAALNSWIEFAKKNKVDLYKKAIKIVSVEDGKKGSVTFKTPAFGFFDISEATDNQAKDLDVMLQDYLKKYLSKNVSEQVDESPLAPFPTIKDAPSPGEVSQEFWAGDQSKIDTPQARYETADDLPFRFNPKQFVNSL